MALQNNTMIVRYKLLSKLVGLWKDGKLEEAIDELPIQLSPKRSRVLGRCCIHKERAVWKYKALPLMGFDMTDEPNELTPLSYYAGKALSRENNRNSKENILCVIDEACSSCVSVKYEITSLCRGCVARNCYMNCPKEAVFFTETGQAKIDHSKCINCGMCQKGCPYHAIVYIPVPCEEACPVGAISKDEYGVEHIDESKCIYCGKCMKACPFGAIFEISQVFDVLESIRKGEEVIAIPAPAVLAQFKAPIAKVYGAIKQIGFDSVIEVATGAMTTTETEGEELLEKMAEGQSFMTTSCCPSYIQLVKKHIPEMAPFVSHTLSPMAYTAKETRAKHPNAKIVFVGPCVGKRKEATYYDEVDYVITFEELNAIFNGLGINVDEAAPYQISRNSVMEAHAFGRSGGVSLAVTNYLKDRAKGVDIIQVADLNKKNVALLKGYAKKGKAPAKFIEVMTCPNGCITGPVTCNPDEIKSQAIFNQALASCTISYKDMDTTPKK